MARSLPRPTGFLLDLDGVVHVRDALIPGALDAIAAIRRAGLPLKFMTNTTRRPRGRIVEDLDRMGVAATPEDVYTPSALARAHMIAHEMTPFLVVHPNLREDFDGLPRGPRTAVVVGDAGAHFTYDLLNRAFRRLHAGDDFLALATNRYFRDLDGGLSLDAGPFVAALEHASGRAPLVFGKPAKSFFVAAVAGLGCDAAQAVMIGDDAEADVGGAMAAGLTGVLVRTGKYQAGQEAGLARPPDLVADDLRDAVARLLG